VFNSFSLYWSYNGWKHWLVYAGEGSRVGMLPNAGCESVPVLFQWSYQHCFLRSTWSRWSHVRRFGRKCELFGRRLGNLWILWVGRTILLSHWWCRDSLPLLPWWHYSWRRLRYSWRSERGDLRRLGWNCSNFGRQRWNLPSGAGCRNHLLPISRRSYNTSYYRKSGDANSQAYF